MFRKIFIVISLVFFVIFGSFILTHFPQNFPQQSLNLFPTLTKSIPFYELTIPYLRERNYKSRLNISEKLSENSNYSSYLTNYDSDGLKINALLTVPIGEAPRGGWPAVVFVHGYIPPKTYQTIEDYSTYIDSLASNQFVVLKIDLRGHGKSEGEPGGSYYSSDYVIDTLNAYSALQNVNSNLVKINPNKIGLWGHSMAGNVIFRGFVAKQNIPAIVIWSGAVYSYEDWQRYGISDTSYQPPPEDSETQRRREELFNAHGRFDPASTFWKQVVPTNYLDGLKGAIQMHHAVNDNVVSVNYSRDLVKILNNTSILHELYEYQVGGHNLAGNSFDQAMQRSIDFFTAHLRE